jgi:hypothetical protein
LEAFIDYQLPNACPDELLFSRLIRHKKLSALTTTDYLEKLFGTRKTSLHPYLTKNLLDLSELTLESSTELLHNQTLAPIYMHFLPQYRQQIRNGLFSSKSNQAIRACQFSSFKQKEVLTIKFCPQCSNNEMRDQGFSYWHVSHQLPGIEVCYLHGAILHNVPIIDRQVFDSLYLPPINQPVNLANELSIGLSKHATEIKHRIVAGTEVTNAEGYIKKLKPLGFVTTNGNIRISKLSNAFYKFCLQFKNVSSSLLPSSAQEHRYLSSLISTSHSQHPFKHFLFSYWLSEQRQSHEVPTETVGQHIIIQNKKIVEEQCLQMLKINSSMGEVSRATGKSSSYIKALAIRNGIELNLMPKKQPPQVIAKIVKLAEMGFHRLVIANRFEVSVGSIEQVISSVPGLVDRRKRGRFESKARRSKVVILRQLQHFPDSRIKDIKIFSNAAYYWLYVNDKKWLKRNMPNPTPPKSNIKIDWLKRDKEVLAKIMKILPASTKKLSRTKVDRLLGSHGWFTKKKEKFPISIKYFSDFYNLD